MIVLAKISVINGVGFFLRSLDKVRKLLGQQLALHAHDRHLTGLL